MMQNRKWRPPAALLLAAVLTAAAAMPAAAQQARLTTPQQHFGHEIGADYQLPNYTKLHQYWIRLANESDRMILDTIGLTAEGRPQIMAIVTSPENHRNLTRYKEIATRLARAEGLSDAEARRLAQEGKAVVWIDGGLHATEVLGAQQLTETLWQMVSGTDPETMRFLNDVIILFVHANPDGHELVADWYMRESDPQRRSSGGIPRLYQKYVGHDNNRDFYLSSQNESTNMNRVLYREWYPQIMYNHHQTGPRGTVLFAPPFRDPFNYNYDPLIVVGLDLVGASMHNRFVAENKPGATMRRGANYSTWWNGGLRTTAYFHNIIGLLTETIGNPTPMEIPLVLDRQLPSGDYPFPIKPQPWRFRQSVDYSVTANKAVLDIASRHREQFLYNIYQMGRNSIQRGSQDTWTMWPSRIAKAEEAMRSGRAAGGQGGGGGGGGFGGGGNNPQAAQRAQQILYAPELRDPRGYILPANQPDFPTATKFVEALMKNGVVVHRATRDFTVGGKQYPAGSYVVKAAQAFRPHIMDMFEPQDHPNDFQYPGGPPIPPYDNAGYTLAYQMGVQFDRILEGFDGPFEAITTELPPVVPGRVNASGRVAGYYLSHAPNDAFVAINRLLKNREDVYWLRSPVTVAGRTYPAGTLWIAAKSSTRPILDALAREKGISFDGAAAKPAVDALKLNPIRIALWDRYGGSMPSGWTRFILENFEFPFEVVFPQQLDAGNLRARYDVIIFPDGAIPAMRQGGGGGGFGGGGGGGGQQNIPEEFRRMLGSVTAERTIPQLRQFVEQGGTILAIGSSTNIAEHLGLPVSDQLVEQQPDGSERPLSREKYYIPGSVLQVSLDRSHPLTHGMGDSAMVFFDNSPVFRLNADAAQKGVRRIAWYASASPLRSGWAWGQQYLENGVAVAEADLGRGKVILYGPEVLFRSQPHGTFKLVFNGLYYPLATAQRP